MKKDFQDEKGFSGEKNIFILVRYLGLTFEPGFTGWKKDLLEKNIFSFLYDHLVRLSNQDFQDEKKIYRRKTCFHFCTITWFDF